MHQPNNVIRQAIREYNEWACLPPPVSGHYVPVNESLASSIATAYAALPKYADDWSTGAAYRELAQQVQAQYQFACSLGYTFEHTTQDPYPNSAAMLADARTGHLRVLKDDGSHPFLSRVAYGDLTYNDLFRAVHDLFGHAAEGFSFGPRGEENAWLHHSMMFTNLARRALSTETRGQNCWVNFGPYRDMPASQRPYAEQKVALLAPELTDWRATLAAGSRI